MTGRELEDLLDKPERQIAAMQSIFDLVDAVGGSDLSIGDLAQIAEVAIEEGHESIIICLNMASNAVQLALDRKKK